MSENNDKIDALSDKLDRLLGLHSDMSTEIDNVRVEIIRLRRKMNSQANPTDESLDAETTQSPDTTNNPSTPLSDFYEDQVSPEAETDDAKPKIIIRRERKTVSTKEAESLQSRKPLNLEKVIGENIINKIGILILIIGVAIGAKYSIENELISPLARIVLGYAVGITLLVLGMRLKKNYHSFSAVLVSGALAIFYFITFFAYDFYALIGHEIAFGLMVIFTIFTVLAALNYDQQIIAHLGLVGAISVPFLLSDNSGNYLFLFSYLALINLGIAFISLRKNWKKLFYSSFVLTWTIFFGWLIFDFDTKTDFRLAFGFLTCFYLLFYVIFVAYKLLNLRKYNVADVIVLLLNAMIFFAIGYNLLQDHPIGRELLGLFAVLNGLVHFAAATIIHKRKLADRNLFYLIVGLVMTCLTLAIPIQLDGHWVTMMWSAEALVLFFIGRSRNVPFYEYLSFALVGIAGLSLIHDWERTYQFIVELSQFASVTDGTELRIFINTTFLTSIVAAISAGTIYWFHTRTHWRDTSQLNVNLLRFLDFALPVLTALVTYFAIRFELENAFSQAYYNSATIPAGTNDRSLSSIYNDTIYHSAFVWIINYTMLFGSLLSILVWKKAKNPRAHWAMLCVNVILLLFFLVQGLYELSELRENYLTQFQAKYYTPHHSFQWLRYVTILIAAILAFTSYLLLKKGEARKRIFAIGESIFYLMLLWVCTSEVIHWLDVMGKSDTYGLVLSIFGGIYAVVVITLGILHRKKHLRILGIAIFAVTLVKLFFFDLASLDTIPKTIVMISLGGLLLLTSFLYNKYKIEDDEMD